MSLEEYQGRENLEAMRVAENYNNFLKDLVRSNCKDPSSILDFGAGVGTFADIFALPFDCISCVEPDADGLQILRDAGYRAYSCLDEAGEGFSYIYSLNVLEHTEHDQLTVDALYSALDPGGRFFVYVPALEVLFSAMDEKVGHFRRYDKESLKNLLENAGFVVEKLVYTDFLGVFATIAYKLWPGSPDGSVGIRQLAFYDKFLFPISRILSIPFARIVGKNVYATAVKPSDRIP